MDPSGVSYRYFATAIGKGTNGAKSQLEKLDLTTLTCREAVIEAAKVIYSQHDPAKVRLPQDSPPLRWSKASCLAASSCSSVANTTPSR